MLFDEMKKEWEEKYKEFKREDAGNAAIDTVKIQAIYIGYLSDERMFLARLAEHRHTLKHDLTEYYLKRHTPELLTKLKKTSPFSISLTAATAKNWVNIDPLMQTANLRIAKQDEKVEWIQNIIENLKSRGWAIKHYIEWQKYQSGLG